MEAYTGGDHWAAETYMIPVPGTNVNLTPAPSLQEAAAVGSELVPEFIVNQGIYYPAAANYYGYYCTGLESPGEWDDHHRFFGLDGQDLHSQGLQTEGMQYVYYTPDYAYAQSLYNPYNPFIPGAVVGTDSPLIATQQYIPSPPAYHQPASSPSYFPTVVHHGMDAFSTVVPDPTPLMNAGGLITSMPENSVVRYMLPSTSVGTTIPVPMESSRAAFQPHALLKSTEGPQHHHSSVKHVPAAGIPQTPQVRNGLGHTQTSDNFPQGNGFTLPTPLKVNFPSYHGFNGFGSGLHWTAGEKRLRHPFTGSLDNGNGTDMLGEQNRGPRTSKSGARSTSPFLVKAYTSKAGNVDENGNIKIDTNQYNRNDFPVNYPNAKFFVIKSYSEDDVHKSIKYNVWSSTPNGNKRLDLVYEDAQRISGVSKMPCPVFLFFSVNASGQFCGVAEMIGPVNFHKDMDFWQQDKWSGSFPVKWHIVKDVPNTSFRHIILENNENKPVTNSRDTQEILYIPGLNMLSIFKDSPMRTSVLDDFIYYEERQRVMHEEKTRLHGRYYGNTMPITTFVPPSKVSVTIKAPPKVEEKANAPKDVQKIDSHHLDAAKLASEDGGAGSHNVTADENVDKIEDKDDMAYLKKIQTLSISSEVNGSVDDSTSSETYTSKVDTITVGTMPVKVNGFGDSSEVLTVTTIALDPKAKAVKEKRSTVAFVTE